MNQHPALALLARQEAVGRLLGNPAVLQQLRDLLGGVRDVERTVGRLTQTGGTGRDLLVLRSALEQVPLLKTAVAAVAGNEGGLLAAVEAELAPLPALLDLLHKALEEEQPAL